MRPAFGSRRAGAPERPALGTGGTSAPHPSAGAAGRTGWVVRGALWVSWAQTERKAGNILDPSQADSSSRRGAAGRAPPAEKGAQRAGRGRHGQTAPSAHAPGGLVCHSHSAYGQVAWLLLLYRRGNEDRAAKTYPRHVSENRWVRTKLSCCVNRRRQRGRRVLGGIDRLYRGV